MLVQKYGNPAFYLGLPATSSVLCADTIERGEEDCLSMLHLDFARTARSAVLISFSLLVNSVTDEDRGGGLGGTLDLPL